MDEIEALARALAENDGFYPQAHLTERPVWTLYENRARRLVEMMKRHLSEIAHA
jgi:hypothetical protein